MPYRFAPRRDGDLAAFCADASKAERELGWRARGLAEMLGDTWRWQEQHPEGYAGPALMMREESVAPWR